LSSYRHDASALAQHRPVSNRYTHGGIDDDMDSATQSREPYQSTDHSIQSQPQAQHYDRIDDRHATDSSDILCRTNESLHGLQTQPSKSPRLFRSGERDKKSVNTSNHEISQSHSSYFNDTLNKKEAEPYRLHHQKIAFQGYLESNIHNITGPSDEDPNARSELHYPQTTRPYFRPESQSSQLAPHALPAGQGRGTASRNLGGGRHMHSYKVLNTSNTVTGQQKKLTDEEENVLSSRGAEEEHHSLQGHHSYGVVQDLTPGGVTPKDLYQHGLGRNHRHATQHHKQAEPHRLGGSHQKCGSVSGTQTSHTSLVKSGQRAAQFGFATAAQQHRSGAPLKSSAATSSLVHSRSTAKHGNSTSKKSAHHGANASAAAGPRQGMQKVGSGAAAASYEPVLRNIQSRES